MGRTGAGNNQLEPIVVKAKLLFPPLTQADGGGSERRREALR